jgi:hypothetical protein
MKNQFKQELKRKISLDKKKKNQLEEMKNELEKSR